MLRPLVADDAAAYAEAAAEEPGATAALSASAWPFDAAAEIAVWEPDPLRNAFAVEETGRFVGVAALQTSGPGEAEGSYWVRGSARGRGVATEALVQLTALAFERGVRRLWLEIAPEHAASLRIAEKVGFVREDVGHPAGWLVLARYAPR